MSKIRAKFDLAIIGGGIVGLATARQLSLKHPKLKLCLIEKEKELALHQSKRNSGVVHCGIYYKKGSLKSKFCIKGSQQIKEYCQAKNLPYQQCGKLIVATRQHELDHLHSLFANAKGNKIRDIELLTAEQVEKKQPGLSNTKEAIWSPNTAIVDWRKVALSYGDDFELNGGTVIKEFVAYDISSNSSTMLIKDAKTEESIEAKTIVCCAGAYSDYFSRRTGNNEHPKVIPFKGNYHLLSEKLATTIKTNIYPVPDPNVPFLGVHITPRIDGSVLVGPTAMLTSGFERYDSSVPFNRVEMYHIFYRSGLTKMLRKKKYFYAGLKEIWRRLSKRRIAAEMREFLPNLKAKDLIETDFCGIRAQLVEKDGRLVDDFFFETGLNPELNRVLHIRNCPSPAATSSLAIAERVVDILEDRLI